MLHPSRRRIFVPLFFTGSILLLLVFLPQIETCPYGSATLEIAPTCLTRPDNCPGMCDEFGYCCIRCEDLPSQNPHCNLYNEVSGRFVRENAKARNRNGNPDYVNYDYGSQVKSHRRIINSNDNRNNQKPILTDSINVDYADNNRPKPTNFDYYGDNDYRNDNNRPNAATGKPVNQIAFAQLLQERQLAPQIAANPAPNGPVPGQVFLPAQARHVVLQPGQHLLLTPVSTSDGVQYQPSPVIQPISKPQPAQTYVDRNVQGELNTTNDNAVPTGIIQHYLPIPILPEWLTNPPDQATTPTSHKTTTTKVTLTTEPRKRINDASNYGFRNI